MMNRVFTSFLGTLDTQAHSVSGGAFDEVWVALRRLLIGELKRRGLWQLPPSYLGIYGYLDWSGLSSSRPGSPDGQSALKELIADCYVFVFIERMDSLRAQLKNCRDIDGFVVLSVRNFLYERQKDHDPLGFRVFKIVRSAVRAAVDDRELYVLTGDSRILNPTLLAFGPDRDPVLAESSRTRLAALVECWNDDLLPELVTTRGRGHHKLLARLRNHLRKLEEQQIEAFFFKDLIHPLKNDARRRWAAVLDQVQGESAIEEDGDGMVRVVSLVRPDTAFEDRDSFKNLIDCIDIGLWDLELDRRTQQYLGTLWHFLIAHAAETTAGHRTPTDSLACGLLPDGDLPSQRKTAEWLKIPRERLPALYGALRQVAEGCSEPGSLPKTELVP